jgi:hypothetical protein
MRPAADADAAQWLLRSDVDWRDLVRYGPPGFDIRNTKISVDGDLVYRAPLTYYTASLTCG